MFGLVVWFSCLVWFSLVGLVGLVGCLMWPVVVDDPETDIATSIPVCIGWGASLPLLFGERYERLEDSQSDRGPAVAP